MNAIVETCQQVLIVDSSNVARDFYGRLLRRRNYRVAEASGGLQAMRLYPHLWPDLVLMDLNMPDVDGLTLLSRIRELDPNATVVVNSSLGHQSVIKEAFRLGAKDYMIKDASSHRLLEILDRVES